MCFKMELKILGMETRIKNTIRIILILLVFSLQIYGNQDSKTFLGMLVQERVLVEDSVYYFADKRAEFPGGDDAMSQFIAKELNYPDRARQRSIEGRVIVRFVVDSTGKIKNPTVLTKTDSILSEEAVRIVSNLPTWKPAEHKGVRVQMYVTVPITFRLH